MTTSQCSYKFMTKRDLISLAITLGFVAVIPLFILCAVSNGEIDRTGSGVELSGNGQLIQTANPQPILIATAKVGGW